MKTTNKDLKQQLEAAQLEAGVLHLALNDALNDKVTWFRSGPYRLGISRETGASGGIVIVRELTTGLQPYACAYYWEKWFPAMRDNYGTAYQVLRLLALDADNWILNQQRIAA